MRQKKLKLMENKEILKCHNGKKLENCACKLKLINYYFCAKKKSLQRIFTNFGIIL